MRPLIYVAGPLGGVGRCEAGDQHDRVQSALNFADDVFRWGAVPFVPHLFWYWATLGECSLGRDDWIAMDREYLARCDALVRLPGESAGSDEEVLSMGALGRPVHLLDYLYYPKAEAFIREIVSGVGPALAPGGETE